MTAQIRIREAFGQFHVEATDNNGVWVGVEPGNDSFDTRREAQECVVGWLNADSSIEHVDLQATYSVATDAFSMEGIFADSIDDAIRQAFEDEAPHIRDSAALERHIHGVGHGAWCHVDKDGVRVLTVTAD